MKARFPIQIRGTGSYVPERVIDNQHFAGYLDTSDEWIVTRTGIRERRWAAPDQCTSTLATNAARAALDNAGMTIKDIDLIMVATATGDCPFPATAAFVQGALGGGDIPAFDIGAACAGFLFALETAAGLITAGRYNNVLVIGAETLSRFCDREERGTAILFGDAAGAAILGPAEHDEQGILHCESGCDGTKNEHIWLPAGGSRMPASETTVAERLHYMHMQGREVFKYAVKKMGELIDRAMTATDITAAELKLLIPHQSNLRIIESFRERIGLPHEKVATNIQRFGNTSAASVAMCLDEARRNGKLQPGDHAMLLAIGAGLTWSIQVWRL